MALEGWERAYGLSKAPVPGSFCASAPRSFGSCFRYRFVAGDQMSSPDRSRLLDWLNWWHSGGREGGREDTSLFLELNWTTGHCKVVNTVGSAVPKSQQLLWWMKRARVAVRAASSLLLKIQFVGTLVRSWRHDVAECVAVWTVFMTVQSMWHSSAARTAWQYTVLISLFRTLEFRYVWHGINHLRSWGYFRYHSV